MKNCLSVDRRKMNLVTASKRTQCTRMQISKIKCQRCEIAGAEWRTFTRRAQAWSKFAKIMRGVGCNGGVQCKSVTGRLNQ